MLRIGLILLGLCGVPSVLAETMPYDVTLSTPTQSLNLAETHGQPLLLSFFFTHCPSACPLQMAKIRNVQRGLATQVKNKTKFVSISIDPARDDMAAIAGYAQQFQADQDHWLFARTKTETEISQLLDHLSLEIRQAVGAEIDHQMKVYLFDHQGRIVQHYVGNRLNEKQVIADLTYLAFQE